MKEKMKKISTVMKEIFGYGMLLSLLVSALVFIGFIVALIVGGEAAVKISEFLYKGVVPVLIYATSILVLFGLVAMYFGGEANSKKKLPNAKEKADTLSENGDGEKPEPKDEGAKA